MKGSLGKVAAVVWVVCFVGFCALAVLSPDDVDPGKAPTAGAAFVLWSVEMLGMTPAQWLAVLLLLGGAVGAGVFLRRFKSK